MKNNIKTLINNFLRMIAISMVVFAATAVISISASAQSLVTFAQFIEKNGSQDFNFVNGTSSAGFSTVTGGSPIYFRYQNIANLDPSLRGFQDAVLVMNSATTTAATTMNSALAQPIDGGVNAGSSSIQILRDQPATVGNGSRRNLLTIIFSPNTSLPSINGNNGGNSATFSVSTPDQTITFTSDFLNFSMTSQRNLALSFSSVVPGLNIGSGGFLANFTAAGSGTFASNPPPTVAAPPTAAPAALRGRTISPAGDPLSRVTVTVTEADGKSRSTISNAFGYFQFPAIETGQVLVITARSKGREFSPAVISFNQSISDLWLFSDQPSERAAP